MDNPLSVCSEIELENRRRNPEWFLLGHERNQEGANRVRAEACEETVRRTRAKEAIEAQRIASLPPVDRSARVLIDGSPVTDDHRNLLPNGQQKDYIVLTAEERSKGFVRPVRGTYTHIVCGVDTSMGLALAETYARDPGFYSGTFCVHCATHKPLSEFVWAGTKELLGN